MPDDGVLERQAGRDERIAHLEGRLARRPLHGIRTPLAVVALLTCGALLALQAGDLRYFFSPRTPLSLGAEGDYRFDALVSNRYVQLHGLPTLRGAYARTGGTVYVAVGLRDSPFVVWREALAGEEWRPGQVPPPPDPRPFAVRGRLLSEQEAPRRFAEAFRQLRALGEVRPRAGQLWLVVEGERPGEDLGRLAVSSLLIAFGAAHAWLLVRTWRRRPRG
jgi:hypothetical protein